MEKGQGQDEAAGEDFPGLFHDCLCPAPHLVLPFKPLLPAGGSGPGPLWGAASGPVHEALLHQPEHRHPPGADGAAGDWGGAGGANRDLPAAKGRLCLGGGAAGGPGHRGKAPGNPAQIRLCRVRGKISPSLFVFVHPAFGVLHRQVAFLAVPFPGGDVILGQGIGGIGVAGVVLLAVLRLVAVEEKRLFLLLWLRFFVAHSGSS